MKTDNIRAMFTYLTAFTIVVGGFILIYLSRLDPTASTMQVLIGGFIGASISFLFTSESTKSATVAAANATAAGAAATPTTTVSAGPPVTVTTTPTPAEDVPVGLVDDQPNPNSVAA